MIYTAVCYSYALVMLYVFYYIPKQSGLVLDALTGDQNQSIYVEDGMNKSLLYQENSAKAMIQAMQNEKKFEQAHITMEEEDEAARF